MVEAEGRARRIVDLLNRTADPLELQLLVNGLRRAGVAVKGPDLRTSGRAWELGSESGAARCPLTQIHGLSPRLVDRLIATRATRPFDCGSDAIARSAPSERETALLVRSGSLDGLAGGLTRPQHLWLLVDLLKRGAPSLFDPDPPRCLGELSAASKLRDERRTLGLLLSCHPVDLLSSRIARLTRIPGFGRLAATGAVRGCRPGPLSVAAMVAVVAPSIAGASSARDRFPRLLLEDSGGYCRAVVRGGAEGASLARGECYLFTGTVECSPEGGLLAIERSALLDRSFSGVYVFYGP